MAIGCRLFGSLTDHRWKAFTALSSPSRPDHQSILQIRIRNDRWIGSKVTDILKDTIYSYRG